MEIYQPIITGSLTVTGSTSIIGSLNVSNGITGSFSGSIVGYVPNTQTGSFVLNSQTSSFGISQGKVVAIATGLSNLF